jgi:hypothetical protein
MITVHDMIQALSGHERNKPVYIELLGRENAAVFHEMALGENEGAVQISAFAEEDSEGVYNVAGDLQSVEWNTNVLDDSDVQSN